jgi:hypothetical protein
LQNVSNTMRAMAAGCLLLVFCLVMASCAATQVQQVWMDETSRDMRLNSVLIVVLVSEPSTRRMFESEFARYFKYRGIKTIESFRDFEIETFYDKDTRDAILARMKEKGSDAVLLTRVVDRRSKVEVIPGMTITTGMGMWGGYSAAAVYSFPGPTAPTTQSYSHEQTFLALETNLFDARTEKLLWSIRTETRISGPPQEEIKPYVELVAKKLLSTKLFP